MINNNAEISGLLITDLEFSHEFYGEKYYKTTIASERQSTVIDYITIIISERILFDELSCGDYVYVTGSIRTRNEKTENGNHLYIYIFADSISLLEQKEDIKYIDANTMEIIGFICKKENIRSTPMGRTILDVICAVNRDYNKSDYLPCIIWGRDAIYTDSLPIGTKVKLYGRIQSRNYTKDNKDKIAYELSVKKVEVCDRNVRTAS